MRTKSLIAVLITFAFSGVQANAQPGRSDYHVKAAATATKPDADGKQTVTITLDIEKGFYLYANPVNHEFLEGSELKVKIAAKEPVKTTVRYPTGKSRVFGGREKFDIYEGVVKIDAQVVRTNGDTGPLTIHVAIQAADGKV